MYSPTSQANDCPIIASYSTISSLLTLFSKFFSPFLRSTCSLSVSQKYLALEEVYLPIRAAIPNNPTLRVPSYDRVVAKDWAITIYGVLFQGTYATTVPSENLYRLQFQPSAGRITNLSFSLFTRSYWGYHCYFLFLPLLILFLFFKNAKPFLPAAPTRPGGPSPSSGPLRKLIRMLLVQSVIAVPRNE